MKNNTLGVIVINNALFVAFSFPVISLKIVPACISCEDHRG